MVEKRPKNNFSRAAIQGTVWRYLTFFSGKLMVFISTVVLARILSKDEFGVVGFAVTTIGFLDVVSDLGVGAALIYYPEDERMTVTAFWLNLLNSIGLFLLTWVLAPWVAAYFRDDRAIEVIRILGLTYPIGALGDIHEYLLRKKLRFNKTFMPEFLRAVIKGGASIVFAFLGLGAWSLILGQLCGVFFSAIAYWFSFPWRPSFSFDLKMAGSLLNYGYKFLGASVLGTLLVNFDYLLVGRYLGAEKLGLYTLAFRLPDLLILQFARVLSTVIFPIYTRMQEETGNMARGFFLTTRYISLITVPLGLGLALVARPFTLVVFTEKWIDAVPVMQAISIYSVLFSLAYNAGSAYKAQGRPQIITWLGLARLVMLVPILWWAVAKEESIIAVGWGQALVALLSGAINLYVAALMLGLPLGDLWDALLPSVWAGLIMSVVAVIVLKITPVDSPLLQMILSVPLGGTAYLASLWFFQRDVVLDAVQKFRLAITSNA